MGRLLILIDKYLEGNMKKLQFSALLVFGLIFLSSHAYSQQSKLSGNWTIKQTSTTQTVIGTVNFDRSCFYLRGTGQCYTFSLIPGKGRYSFIVRDKNIKFENLAFSPKSSTELRGSLIDGNAAPGSTNRFAVVFTKKK